MNINELIEQQFKIKASLLAKMLPANKGLSERNLVEKHIPRGHELTICESDISDYVKLVATKDVNNEPIEETYYIHIEDFSEKVNSTFFMKFIGQLVAE